MNNVDRSVETRLAHAQARAGKSLDELFELLRKSGRLKYGELRDFLRAESISSGDAKALVKAFLRPRGAIEGEAAGSGVDEAVNALYAGEKTALRPVHEAVMALVASLGPFEAAPRKDYLSLRRSRRFAMIGPIRKGRLELGLDMEGVQASERLMEQAPGSPCGYKVYLRSVSDVDGELAAWLRLAFEGAGQDAVKAPREKPARGTGAEIPEDAVRGKGSGLGRDPSHGKRSARGIEARARPE